LAPSTARGSEALAGFPRLYSPVAFVI